MGLLESINSKAFLGEEFLTWLLWRGDVRNGLVGIGDLEVHIGAAVWLRAPFGEAQEVALRGENPAASPELVAALREGKLVARAQMRWVVDGVEWNVAARGETLAVGGLRPPLRAAPPDAEWIERRLALMDDFATAFDQAFDAFLTIRLSGRDWKKETEAMGAWVAGEPSAEADREAAPDIIEITDSEAK